MWNKALCGWSRKIRMISPQLGMVSISAQHAAALLDKAMKLPPGKNQFPSVGALDL